jgi:hypothetical protein
MITKRGVAMANLDIAHLRLHNQLISHKMFAKPEDVVRWLGAVQAQDYAAAKWAVGSRLSGASDDDIEQAYDDGLLLRTHVMRPTWHFVSPADIRWLLELTAPRVKAAISYYDRKLELDDATFISSNAALVKALQDGHRFTRSELAIVLKHAGIATDNLQRFNHILMHAELDGVVCSGARRGNQFTYALLDERAPQTRKLDRDEALAKLAKRYFTGHGPATLQDFVWWSGLTVADARNGLEMATSQLVREIVDGFTYWFAASTPPAQALSQTTYLLPNYDEYVVGYTDRSAVFDESHTNKLDARGNVLFNHIVVVDGQVIGTWKRTVKKEMVTITPSIFTELAEDKLRALNAAAERYGMFLGRTAHVSFPVVV